MIAFILKYRQLALIAALGLTIFLFYNHYTRLNQTIKKLNQNNAILSQQLSAQKEMTQSVIKTVDKWQKAQQTLQAQIRELNNVSAISKQRINDLQAKFAKRGFAEITRRKPGLVEKRINVGTTNTLRMFRCASGSTNSNDRCTPATADTVAQPSAD